MISKFRKELIQVVGNDISSVIQKYLLSPFSNFEYNIMLLKNIQRLWYIDLLDNNLKPSSLKKPYIKMEGTSIRYIAGIYDNYLRDLYREEDI
jgi:hypothetical protein